MFRLISFVLLVAFLLNQVARITVGDVGITVLDVCVGFVSIMWMGKNIFSLKKILWEDSIGRVWIYFLLAALFSLTVNIGYLSHTQFGVALLYLLRWMLYSSIFFIVRNLSKEQKTQIPRLLLIAGGSIVVLGFLQYFFYPNLRNLFYLGWDEHMYRLFSVFLDPNFAGAFYVLFIIFLSTKLLKPTLASLPELLIKKWLLVATIGALLLTFSRSALIMFVVSLFALFLLEHRKKIIVPLVLGIGVFILSISQFFYLENINLFRIASSKARIESAQHAFQIFAQQPIFGVGFNAYKYAQVRMGYRVEHPLVISHADNGTDNSFLFILATTGIVGTGFFLLFWYKLFAYVLKKQEGKLTVFATIGLISIIGIIVNSFFLHSLFYPPLLLWLWVVLGLSDYK